MGGGGGWPCLALLFTSLNKADEYFLSLNTIWVALQQRCRSGPAITTFSYFLTTIMSKTDLSLCKSCIGTSTRAKIFSSVCLIFHAVLQLKSSKLTEWRSHGNYYYYDYCLQWPRPLYCRVNPHLHQLHQKKLKGRMKPQELIEKRNGSLWFSLIVT